MNFNLIDFLFNNKNKKTKQQVKISKYNIDIEDMERNTIIFGGTGSGKTKTVLLPILESLIEKQYPGVIIDVKNNFTSDVYKIANKYNSIDNIIEISDYNTSENINIINNISYEMLMYIVRNSISDSKSQENGDYWEQRGIEIFEDISKMYFTLYKHKKVKVPTMSFLHKLCYDKTIVNRLFYKYTKHKKLYKIEYKELIEKIKGIEFHILKIVDNQFNEMIVSDRLEEQLGWTIGKVASALAPFSEPENQIKFSNYKNKDFSLNFDKLFYEDKKIIVLRFKESTSPILTNMISSIINLKSKQDIMLSKRNQYTFKMVDEYQNIINPTQDASWLDKSREFKNLQIFATQSISALLSKGDKNEIFTVLDNCKNKFFLNTNDVETMEYYNKININDKFKELKFLEVKDKDRQCIYNNGNKEVNMLLDFKQYAKISILTYEEKIFKTVNEVKYIKGSNKYFKGILKLTEEDYFEYIETKEQKRLKAIILGKDNNKTSNLEETTKTRRIKKEMFKSSEIEKAEKVIKPYKYNINDFIKEYNITKQSKIKDYFNALQNVQRKTKNNDYSSLTYNFKENSRIDTYVKINFNEKVTLTIVGAKTQTTTIQDFKHNFEKELEKQNFIKEYEIEYLTLKEIKRTTSFRNRIVIYLQGGNNNFLTNNKNTHFKLEDILSQADSQHIYSNLVVFGLGHSDFIHPLLLSANLNYNTPADTGINLIEDLLKIKDKDNKITMYNNDYIWENYNMYDEITIDKINIEMLEEELFLNISEYKKEEIKTKKIISKIESKDFLQEAEKLLEKHKHIETQNRLNNKSNFNIDEEEIVIPNFEEELDNNWLLNKLDIDELMEEVQDEHIVEEFEPEECKLEDSVLIDNSQELEKKIEKINKDETNLIKFIIKEQKESMSKYTEDTIVKFKKIIQENQDIKQEVLDLKGILYDFKSEGKQLNIDLLRLPKKNIKELYELTYLKYMDENETGYNFLEEDSFKITNSFEDFEEREIEFKLTILYCLIKQEHTEEIKTILIESLKYNNTYIELAKEYLDTNNGGYKYYDNIYFNNSIIRENIEQIYIDYIYSEEKIKEFWLKDLKNNFSTRNNNLDFSIYKYNFDYIIKAEEILKWINKDNKKRTYKEVTKYIKDFNNFELLVCFNTKLYLPKFCALERDIFTLKELETNIKYYNFYKSKKVKELFDKLLTQKKEEQLVKEIQGFNYEEIDKDILL